MRLPKLFAFLAILSPLCMGMGFPNLLPEKDDCVTQNSLTNHPKRAIDPNYSVLPDQKECGLFSGATKPVLFTRGTAGFGCKGN